ncbi:hypothetical protein H0I68_16110 [Yersinia kristensenii]|uniref:hypothetical protein n=1 Tax=Yersinia kristensenii TaxID=28152 RepID=UPI001C609F1F|nr:hypothetical protein [Yersinia kristensenii]MBW5826567.1 hypothetical protein [Yersinia kristensenii]
MNEKPILFNSEMVNAILSGRKTQTRRIMGNQPAGQDLETVHVRHNDDFNFQWYGNLGESSYFPCPLGKPGDQLWVRETFALLGNEDGVCVDWQDNMVKGDEQAAARIYKASCEQKHGDYGLYSIPDSAYWKPDTTNMKYEGTWRPSIHMPRCASRINLLITGVRVERLNDISEKDAMAEGITAKEVIIETRYEGGGHVEITAERFFFVGGDDEGYESAGEAFAELWDSIYGQKEGENWQANPWVWVINFERMEAK